MHEAGELRFHSPRKHFSITVGVMKIELREPQSKDWPAILAAANASLPWQTDGNQQWLQFRMQFDSVKFPRRHYVAVDSSSGKIVGYGSIEGGETPGRFRVFVVMDAQLLADVGEIIYQRLRNDLSELNAEHAWVREEVRDVKLLAFFENHGFMRSNQYRTPGGLEIVLLEQKLHPTSA
jgi:hypothetical protein